MGSFIFPSIFKILFKELVYYISFFFILQCSVGTNDKTQWKIVISRNRYGIETKYSLSYPLRDFNFILEIASCDTNTDKNRAKVDSNQWFSWKISLKPFIFLKRWFDRRSKISCFTSLIHPRRHPEPKRNLMIMRKRRSINNQRNCFILWGKESWTRLRIERT